MSRLACLFLVSMLSVTGGTGLAYGYDQRVHPDLVRHPEIGFVFSKQPLRTLGAITAAGLSPDKPQVSTEYASAMTWYRIALSGGYGQAPIVASPWLHDEQLPEPLHWAWMADNGNFVTRAGKGIFRLSFANSRGTWFRDLDCRLLLWPEGNADAPMICDDGTQRTLQVAGNGVILVDNVPYARVFESEATTLPPVETVAEIEARQGLEATGSAVVEEDVPIPQPRPDNPGDRAAN